MIANFYIIPESFAYNWIDTLVTIENKVKQLSKDVQLIRIHKSDNRLYSNHIELMKQTFYSTYTVTDFICSPQKMKQIGVDRDVINALQSILQKSENTSVTLKEVINELLNWIDEDNVHGIIAFNKIEEIEESMQVIYSIDNWYTFRRYYLSKYPKDAVHFMNECEKYFPKLFFHERIKETIKKILKDCPEKIIFHLSALNDLFENSLGEGRNRTDVLEHFSIAAKLDETASLEGDASRKSSFTFDFINEKGELEKVCCEPHLKLCYNDFNSSYSTNRRIYFREGKPTLYDGRILIGHIGIHL